MKSEPETRKEIIQLSKAMIEAVEGLEKLPDDFSVPLKLGEKLVAHYAARIECIKREYRVGRLERIEQEYLAPPDRDR